VSCVTILTYKHKNRGAMKYLIIFCMTFSILYADDNVDAIISFSLFEDELPEQKRIEREEFRTAPLLYQGLMPIKAPPKTKKNKFDKRSSPKAIKTKIYSSPSLLTSVDYSYLTIPIGYDFDSYGVLAVSPSMINIRSEQQAIWGASDVKAEYKSSYIFKYFKLGMAFTYPLGKKKELSDGSVVMTGTNGYSSSLNLSYITSAYELSINSTATIFRDINFGHVTYKMDPQYIFKVSSDIPVFYFDSFIGIVSLAPSAYYKIVGSETLDASGGKSETGPDTYLISSKMNINIRYSYVLTGLSVPVYMNDDGENILSIGKQIFFFCKFLI